MSNVTIQELFAQTYFQGLTPVEKLAEVQKTLPKLENHPVVKLFPQMSQESKEALEARLILGGQAAVIYVSKDFELVHGEDTYEAIKKFTEAGKWTAQPLIVFCNDPAVTRRELCFGHIRYNPNQLAAIIYKMGYYKELQKQSKERMAHQFPNMPKRRTTEQAAWLYHIGRNNFDAAVRVGKYDSEHGKDYLQFVAEGKATFKQIETELIGNLIPQFVEFMEIELSKGDSTYDSAVCPEDLYDESFNPGYKTKKVGELFSKIKNNWLINLRKAKEQEQKDKRNMERDQKLIARVKGKVNGEVMPNSHPEPTKPAFTWTNSPNHKIELKILRKTTKEQAKKLAVYIQMFYKTYHAYSIEFIDGNTSTYLDVPAINVVDQSGATDYRLKNLHINVEEIDPGLMETCEECCQTSIIKNLIKSNPKKSGSEQKIVS